MASPIVVPVVFGMDPLAHDLVTFVGQLARSTYWTMVTGAFGVGALNAAPAVELDGAPPVVSSTADVERWLGSELMSSSIFPSPSDETIYALFLPTTSLPYAGYHADLALPTGAVVSYAIVVSSGAIDDVTSTASHELVEVATNPRPLHEPAWADLDPAHRGWELLESPGGSGADFRVGEIGDLCPVLIQPYGGGVFAPPPPGAPPPMLPPWSLSSISMTGIDHRVQRVWSNRAAAMLQDPCVPFGLTPYFVSAPETPDVVVAVDHAGNPFTTRGVHIPLEENRTIDVHLFSDTPTAPWSVDLWDATDYGAVASTSSARTLEVATFFDRDQGKNSDVLHLTMRPRTHVVGGTHLLVIRSTLPIGPPSMNGAAQTVWPLVVVE
jgi:hypothetical protein